MKRTNLRDQSASLRIFSCGNNCKVKVFKYTCVKEPSYNPLLTIAAMMVEMDAHTRRVGSHFAINTLLLPIKFK